MQKLLFYHEETVKLGLISSPSLDLLLVMDEIVD